MEKQLPKTKEECFALLDAMLSEEDKDELRNCEDTILYHFSLGMWIRNNWIYPMSNEEMRSLKKKFVDKSELVHDFMFVDADSLSATIIDNYVEYLKNKS